MNKRLPVLLLALLLAIMPAAGCTSAPASGISKPQTITIAESSNFLGGFASIYGPQQGNSFSYYYYIGNFYETLVNYDNGKITPGLAESWQVSDDGLVYTFSLRQGVKFSDGSDLTAEVVKLNLDNFNTILGVHGINYGLLNSLIEEVVAVDEHVLEIHLQRPYFATLINLAMVMPRGIMAAAAFQEDGTFAEALATATFGTGPYMYAGDTKDHREYTFVRNPYYHGEKPPVDAFTVKVIPDNEAKVLALRNDEVDFISGTDNISYSAYLELDKSAQYTGKVSGVNVLTEFLAQNTTAAPFDDLKVRQAVQHAVDKKGLAENLFGGLKTAADTIMDTALPYCDIAVTPYDYNPAKAQTLLTEAGWADSDGDGILEKNGQRLGAELKYVANATNDQTALAIQANLKDIGMEVTLTGLELMAFYSDIYSAGDYTLTYYESYGILYDPFTFVANMNPNLDYSKFSFSTDPMVSKALPSLSYHEAYELTGGLLSLVGEDNIRAGFHYALETAHRDGVLVPVTYLNEIAVFNGDVIADYTFGSQPSWVNVAGIALSQ
ncbi:ABC transporter substrate-binding protein [Desulfitobacterium chlororespirans]|uniref:Nickel transport system substrate-binding protein n=1 Tax=Desulfitobacterium chlororespirans DSM 11544 TaxID=1121395 RepID=A0A1M7TIC9_9FIRM|nr:ABC transporter substrate-binding protein [Desulfitobacterium chlororespirans]SHN70529.1 nickel transport system substrate-binding protein [Desulfitobacterium chlororespirans DSM 11544]